MSIYSHTIDTVLQRPIEFTQYVSLGFGLACTRAGISRSIGSVGDCYDNAVAETFFATLKKELVYRRSWSTRQELCSEVFEYIEGFYNPRRRHSTLGMLSPDEFEAQHADIARTRARKTSTTC
jgi:putative transposase